MAKVTLMKIVDAAPAPRKPVSSALVMTAAQREERIAKLATDVSSFAANTRVDEVFAALAKRDATATGELLQDPQTYEAYRARMAGERWQAPVAKAVTSDTSGHFATIKKHLEEADHEGLRQLFHSDPAAYDTYGQMVAAGLTGAYREVAKMAAATEIEKRRHEVPKGKATAQWKQRILAAWKAKDNERLSAMRASRDPDFIASWAELVAEGKIKPHA